jgi:Uma2 family endonuclease
MAARIRERATYDDVIKAPDDKIAELIDGELFLSPRPRIRHAHILTQLASGLQSGFGSVSGGWLILIEPEVHLDGEVFVPDVVGWRSERLSLTGDELWMDVVPDWVCEILSPSTAAYDRRVKLPKYAHHGVKHAWIIDPVNRNIEVRRLVDGAWVEVAVFNADEPFRAEPFEELEIVLDVQWPSPPS